VSAGEGRVRWTDDRLDDQMIALREVPASVARIAVKVDALDDDSTYLQAAVEKVNTDCATRDRRLHERIDLLNDRLADRDREYRRNIVLALGPIAVVALLIGAKLLFGIDVVHP
jgi:hypothetical protein